MFKWLRDIHRAKVRARPFSDEQRAILEKNVPYVAKLTAEEREELVGHVQVFLDEKSFEGAGGLEMTDEIRITIAAQACLLLLHRDTDYYPGLLSIIVYPSTFVRKGRKGMLEQDTTLLGESHSFDRVVVAWDSAKLGAKNFQDAHNVVLHEFAHQLDYEDGLYDGTPELPNRSAIRTWAKVFSEEFKALAEHGDSVLDSYGAENSAEFFAVATEAFFEKPVQLREKHPELYAQLVLYFQQDPAKRLG
jgi:Mlc titration factor MtfA (ptsG expression regulator)